MMDTHHGWYKSFKPSVVGFLLSLALTFLTYFLVTGLKLSGQPLLWTAMGLGVLQAIIQLIFFLHLGLESKPRWSMMSFLFTVLVILIIVFGSIWIMWNLNYNLHPTSY